MSLLFFQNDYTPVLPELFLLISTILSIIFLVVYSTSSPLNFPVLLNTSSWLVLQTLVIALYLNIHNYCYNVIALDNSIITDFFSYSIKTVVLIASISVVLMSLSYFKFETINSFELSLLIIFATLGSLLLISSYSLISMYLAIELQSFCSYIICAFKRNSEYSAEASLKYFILGAFSTGFLLFGCSFIYGFTGSTSYKQISMLFLELGYNHPQNYGVAIGITFVLISFLFKLSAAPFHLWSPDIYEGSPTIVTAFFAIVPKLGLLAVIIRIFFDSFYVFFYCWQFVFFLSSIISMIIGCFGAIWQTKLKRLLAFSSISHVGFMLIGICCGSIEGISALIFYSIIYVIASISSFSFLLTIRKNDNKKRIKYIEDLAIISKTNPFIAILTTIVFFSIAGVPPLAGFFSKLFIISSSISHLLYSLAFIGVLTSIVSCFYYIRVIQTVYFEQINEYITTQKNNKETSILLSLSVLLLLIFFFHPNMLFMLTYNISIDICT
uniref:NADH dehydrogenase subunit 2 n=1 Tax=Cryptomonas gyropyrenoidosa TaxID=233257 RepID=UPI002798543C|nr:NADH dehydrogenase subunit 2 [Cryptomonas gyropyrenoidosa]WFQ82704.1 NADH dehydrogenase subunit 2 [Cryptomonas gyropyrenoidosa]